MTRRTMVHPILLAILLNLGLSLHPDLSHARQSDKELFESGQSCKSDLMASKKKQQYRIYWERCIQSFERIGEWYPDSALMDQSLFEMGSLYDGLHRISGHSFDLSRSTEAFRKLSADHPGSPLTSSAQSRLKILNPDTKVTIEGVRFFDYPDYTRLVLDMDGPATLKEFSKDHSDVIRFYLVDSQFGPELSTQLQSLESDLLQWVSFDSSASSQVEVLISLKGPIKEPKITPLESPHRLVLDLFRSSPVLQEESNPTALKTALPIPSRELIRTIVIDPGHGGKDPGAIGKRGLTEKEIVLDIALRLRKLIATELGRKVILTREEDHYISLNDRTHLANSRKADLFLSIHANAHPKRSKRGIEVYLLGRSSDKRALAVAARENSVPIELAGQLDQSVQNILLDLNLAYKMDQSLEFAHIMGDSLISNLAGKNRYQVGDLRVKQAPFYVLLNSSMPGILAEVSYLSNPTDERLLREPGFRQLLAEALFEGLQTYIDSVESPS